MNFGPKKNILLSLFHGLRLSSNEGLHTSRFVMERNYYDVLNVDPKCNAKEIRDSFIHLAKKYHPDTNQNDPSSHARFIELQKAYTVLSTPSKRHEYDLGLSDFSVEVSYRNPYKRPRGGTSYEDADNFSEEFKEYFYQSRMKSDEPPPRLRVGLLRLTFLFVAFTTVGALVQFYVIKWLYRRTYNEEMERHHKGTASYYALKEAMDNQEEEYDVKKLRNAYYKHVGQGPIAMQLIPALIRPKLPTENGDSSSEKGELIQDLKVTATADQKINR